jgi:hypothetical protein
MNNQQVKNEKEEKVRLASGVFLAMFFGSLIAALLNFENESQRVGLILLACSILFLVVTIAAYFRPLISTIVGLVIYVILVSWLLIIYGVDLINGGGGRALILFVVGFILILGAVKDSMKKKT